jgi:hypothetical protein
MAVFSPIQLIASIPPVTRYFVAATFLFSLSYIYSQWRGVGDPGPYLTLIPGSSLFYPWTFFFSVFVETSIYEVCPHAPLGQIPLVTPLPAYFHARHGFPWSALLGTALGWH